MRKISMAALAAATLLCTVTSCGDSAGTTSVSGETLTGQLDRSLASAKTFADSITAIDGAFIGGFFNSQTVGAGLPKPINKSEFIRGMRDALRTDTADMSYIYGFNAGATALQTYMELAKNEGVNRDAFVNAIVAAFRIDSISQDELMQVRQEFENYNRMMTERAEARAKEEAVNSEAGKANIAAAEAYAARLKAADDFSEVAPGIYARVITPGTGDNLKPNDRVNVTYTLSHLDGTEINSVSTPRPMYVSAPTQPVLRAILPLMNLGETADFYLPYEHAYGEIGNESAGVGPCEALMVHVTVAEIAQ